MKFRILSVVIAIAASAFAMTAVHAAESPQFTAPQQGQTYTDIPDVRWTSPANATEHQLFVMCYGCLDGASFLPLTYRFTVHQPYLEFSYAELETFLHKHNITPDDRVNIRVYVRTKVDGSFTRWSSPMQFFAEKRQAPVRPELRTSIYVDANGMATVYGYADRRLDQMQLTVGSNLPGNTSVICHNTNYCILRGIGPLAPGSRHHGLIVGDHHMTDFRIDVPGIVSEPVSATIFPRENNDGTVTFYNHTTDNVVVDTIQIYINGQVAASCNNAYYCPYRHASQESVTYAVRTVQDGQAYFSGYQTYQPAQTDNTAPTVTRDITFDPSEGTVKVAIFASDESDIRGIRISVNGTDIKTCKYANSCTVITEAYPDNTLLHIRAYVTDMHLNEAYKLYTVRTKKDAPVVVPPPTTPSTEAVPVIVQIYETVYNGNNVVAVKANTEDRKIVDRLNILVNAKLANECTDTNVCIAYMNRDELGSSFSYGVNSYLGGERYWSGYKGKRL